MENRLTDRYVALPGLSIFNCHFLPSRQGAIWNKQWIIPCTFRHTQGDTWHQNVAVWSASCDEEIMGATNGCKQSSRLVLRITWKLCSPFKSKTFIFPVPFTLATITSPTGIIVLPSTMFRPVSSVLPIWHKRFTHVCWKTIQLHIKYTKFIFMNQNILFSQNCCFFERFNFLFIYVSSNTIWHAVFKLLRCY